MVGSVPPNGPVAVNGWAKVSTKVLFFSGLGGVVYEAGWHSDPRPSLLLLYGVMMGLAKLGDIIQLLVGKR